MGAVRVGELKNAGGVEFTKPVIAMNPFLVLSLSFLISLSATEGKQLAIPAIHSHPISSSR